MRPFFAPLPQRHLCGERGAEKEGEERGRSLAWSAGDNPSDVVCQWTDSPSELPFIGGHEDSTSMCLAPGGRNITGMRANLSRKNPAAHRDQLSALRIKAF